MIIQKFETEEEWLAAREGKITGTKAGGLVSKRDKTTKLKGWYQLAAERIAIPANSENVMDRGKRLEEEAVERFAKETGKKVKKTTYVLCTRDDDDSIGYSPDAMIGKTEDVEAKCLNSASHLEAMLTKEVPSEYREQIIQGFVVNDKLKRRYMVFLDPRMPKDFFYLTIERKDVQQEVEQYLAFERSVLAEIRALEDQLTF
jgi:predicted phage-related endonuclease